VRRGAAGAAAQRAGVEGIVALIHKQEGAHAPIIYHHRRRPPVRAACHSGRLCAIHRRSDVFLSLTARSCGDDETGRLCAEGGVADGKRGVEVLGPM
jgi:hypothetical protein